MQQIVKRIAPHRLRVRYLNWVWSVVNAYYDNKGPQLLIAE